MSSLNKKIHINVHGDFYNNIFEPERRKMSNALGMGNKLSIPQFTQILARSGATIKYPRKMPKQNLRNKFAPKKLNLSYGKSPFSLI